MQWVVGFFSVVVATLRLEIETFIVPSCNNFMKIFIFKKCLSFSKWSWNIMVILVSNILPWSCDVFPHFRSSKKRVSLPMKCPRHFQGNSRHPLDRSFYKDQLLGLCLMPDWPCPSQNSNTPQLWKCALACRMEAKLKHYQLKNQQIEL